MGEDKVLMFVRSIDREERMDIEIKLEDKDCANGLTKDWAEIESVCRRHDEKRTRTLSARTWPMSDSQKRVTSDDLLPPKRITQCERVRWYTTTCKLTLKGS